MKTVKSWTMLIWISCFLLTGCNADISDNHINDPIAASGDSGYYGAMTPAERKNLLQQHIRISGTVFSSGYTTFYIGDPAVDGISISCTFSEHSEALASIQAGDRITLHGICSGVIGNYLYLDHCQLSGIDTTVPSSAPDTTTQPGTQDTTVPSTATQPATTPTTPPTTAPTVPTPTAPPTTAPTVPTPTVPPTTAPTVVPSTPVVPPVTTPSTPPETTPSASAIQFIKWPETVSRNETAEVTIQGKPNTQYSITVYYKSGPSSAKGLEPQTSDSSGYVTWTWKVGGKTAAGTFRIVVSGGEEENTVNFTVKTE